MSTDSINAANVGDNTDTQLDTSGPRVLHQGRYRLYENPDGGLRIQYRVDGRDEDDFVMLPGPIVALGKAAAEGKMSPIELMRKMVGLMGDMRK